MNLTSLNVRKILVPAIVTLAMIFVGFFVLLTLDGGNSTSKIYQNPNYQAAETETAE